MPKRRAQFAAGRVCARRALARLGEPTGAIGAGTRGEPLWPAGIVGSITHCRGYCAAAVGRAAAVATIGIDAEPHDPLPEGVLGLVANGDEQRRLRARGNDGICWDRLLFSAKESIFKAWFPLAGRWLGFEDADVSFAPDEGTFDGRLLVPGPRVGGVELRRFEGRFLVRPELVLTAIAIAPP